MTSGAYYYDNEIGMYYLQSRYYDPQICRFINFDNPSVLAAPVNVGTILMFPYCYNNPVTSYDADGRSPIQAAFAAIGAVVGWLFGDYVARSLGYYSDKGSFWNRATYWTIRAGVVVGGAVVGWFAATALTAIVKTFLLSSPGALLRLPSWVINLFGLGPTYKLIVIGETMARVIAYARMIGAEVYQGISYYKTLEKIFGSKIARKIGGIHNALWIIKKMIEKYHIVDIGVDVSRADWSPYYLMEFILTFFYKFKTYVNNFLK